MAIIRHILFEYIVTLVRIMMSMFPQVIAVHVSSAVYKHIICLYCLCVVLSPGWIINEMYYLGQSEIGKTLSCSNLIKLYLQAIIACNDRVMRGVRKS